MNPQPKPAYWRALLILAQPLTTGTWYDDPGADYFERRHNPAIEAKRLARQIEALSFDVSLIERTA